MAYRVGRGLARSRGLQKTGDCSSETVMRFNSTMGQSRQEEQNILGGTAQQVKVGTHSRSCSYRPWTAHSTEH